MHKHLFTILTDPIPFGRYHKNEFIKKALRKIKYFFNNRPIGSHPFYRGHVAVTRSLIDGLDKSTISYNYNPYFVNEVAPIVIVLAGVSTLQQAINLKRKGKIRKLLAGPNIVVFSSDFNNLIASEEIDCIITPAPIINELYQLDNPSLLGRIKSWPAGVDTNYWVPGALKNNKQILIYEKQAKGPVGPVEPYVHLLEKMNYKVKVIKYGSYSLSEYLLELQKSVLMVGFVTDESQGIAWAEAWASDVPTFIWQNEFHMYDGRKYSCSTAPYLTKESGIFFSNFEDFKLKFLKWENREFDFKPRKWCLENMSDEVCADKLIKIIEKC